MAISMCLIVDRVAAGDQRDLDGDFPPIARGLDVPEAAKNPTGPAVVDPHIIDYFEELLSLV